MSKKEKYKRYGWEDAYDTEIENDWTNRLNLDDCIEIMNNQYNKIEELKQQLGEKNKEIAELKKFEEFVDCLHNYYETSNLKELKSIISEEIEMGNRLADIVEGQDKYIAKIRHQVCDEIKDLAGNYFEFPICENCGESLFASSDVILTGSDLTEILNQVEGENDD